MNLNFQSRNGFFVLSKYGEKNLRNFSSFDFNCGGGFQREKKFETHNNDGNRKSDIFVA
jgi:hypothetical protein